MARSFSPPKSENAIEDFTKSYYHALNEYRKAVRLHPELSHAQLDLGGVLANGGDRAGAREHLLVAVKTNDPGIRDLAQSCYRTSTFANHPGFDMPTSAIQSRSRRIHVE